MGKSTMSMAIFNSYKQLPEGRPYFNNLSMPSVPQKPIGKVTPHKSPQESGIGLVMEGFHPHPNGKKKHIPGISVYDPLWYSNMAEKFTYKSYKLCFQGSICLKCGTFRCGKKNCSSRILGCTHSEHQRTNEV
jgi:hypothetical protein